MRQERGFLLLVVIGLLAVLLALCVGFLTFTRAETASVAHLRDKEDTHDIFTSALNFTIATQCNDLINGSTFKTDASGIVSNVVKSGDAGYRGWYRPFEPGMSKWAHPNWKKFITSDSEAQWVYLPVDYFSVNSVRGRYSVQVIDTNAFININDWLEDCSPSQCQMAHMLQDAIGEQQIEDYRRFRDGGGFAGATPQPRAPIRYHEAWRVGTRTVRYMHWPWSYAYDKLESLISPNWITTNRTYLSVFGAEMHSLRPLIVADGIPLCRDVPDSTFGPSNFIPFLVTTPTESLRNFQPIPAYGQQNYQCGFKFTSLNGFTRYAYTDPDTGRSPVNVNTVYNSGERLPMDADGGGYTYTMEAVFNVEALRRIIKVGEFYYKNAAGVKTLVQARNPAGANFVGGLTPAEQKLAWEKHEQLRMKLAFQYQEALVRYFTGSYRHSMKRTYPPFYNPTIDPPDPTIDAALYPPDDKSDDGTYYTVYAGTPGASAVRYAVKMYDYSQTRFPYGLAEFRQKMAEALTDMAQLAPNGAYAGTDPAGDDSVGFDINDNPEIAQGALDKRTASAVYDNIVPGKATLFGLDPLTELYNAQIARDETQYDPYAYAVNMLYTGNDATLTDSGISIGDKSLRPKGADIAKDTAPVGPYSRVKTDNAALTVVPQRQFVFGPDSFSTELTTTSTTFIYIINAQIVDAASMAVDPNKPRDLFWNQFGVCAELAPDVMVESTSPDGSDWATTGLGYYRGQWPYKRKTDSNVMDIYPDGTKKEQRGEDGVGPERYYWRYASSNPANDRFDHYASGVYRAYTAAKDWIDFRGIIRDPAPDNLPAGPIKPKDFYKDGVQNKKRVQIRAMWSLNQGQ